MEIIESMAALRLSDRYGFSAPRSSRLGDLALCGSDGVALALTCAVGGVALDSLFGASVVSGASFAA